MTYIFKKSYQLLLVAFVLLVACNQKENKPKNTKVDSLISKMTLEEKVGQMTQITLSVFYKKGVLQEEKLKKYIVSNGIGSILNVNESEPLSVEEWHALITKIQDYAKESRLQIPVLYGIDAIHGATYTKNATLFPHNIGLAASRNPKLAFEIAEITAKEVRASGIRWNFDPVLGVGKQPLWPRFEETFGEDVLLVSEFGTQAIKGYQKDNLKSNTNVASCMKHFLGYSVPQSGKDRTPAYIPEIVLRETFIPPFKKAVESGSSTIMINSGSINGIPVHINKYLLTDLLKNEWGFKGFVVTDWEDIMYLHKEHKVAKNNKDAVKMAINAGVDMSMVPNKLDFYHDLIELVNEGEVSMNRVDDAVRRILKVKFDLGLFDNPYPEKEAVANFGLASYKETALKTAEQSMTLLKNKSINNKPVLPLSKNSKVLIAGPAANSLATLHGSWSYTWQGDREHLYAESTLTIKESIENKIGKENVTCVAPNKFQKITTSEINSVTQKAKNADCIILCLGEISYAETKGNIDDLELSKDQITLAKVAIATNKPVILVLTEGRPRIVNEFIEGIDGVLMAYRPGSEGANAIANVLFGDYNPSGKLPFSYPKYSGNLLNYDTPMRNIKTYKPQWAFGEGLSYTSFEYGEIELSTKRLNENESLTVKVKVTNTGKVDGDLVIDLFVKDLVASVIPPMKKLRKFDRVYLRAAESKVVEFTLNKDDLSFVNANLERVTEDGEFEILIGGKSAKFIFSKK